MTKLEQVLNVKNNNITPKINIPKDGYCYLYLANNVNLNIHNTDKITGSYSWMVSIHLSNINSWFPVIEMESQEFIELYNSSVNVDNVFRDMSDKGQTHHSYCGKHNRWWKTTEEEQHEIAKLLRLSVCKQDEIMKVKQDIINSINKESIIYDTYKENNLYYHFESKFNPIIDSKLFAIFSPTKLNLAPYPDYIEDVFKNNININDYPYIFHLANYNLQKTIIKMNRNDSTNICYDAIYNKLQDHSFKSMYSVYDTYLKIKKDKRRQGKTSKKFIIKTEMMLQLIKMFENDSFDVDKYSKLLFMDVTKWFNNERKNVGLKNKKKKTIELC